MAANNKNTVVGTLNWCAASTLNRPSQNVGGFFQEPGLTNANLLMGTILGPPFAWQWNRYTAQFTASPGQTDYSVSIPSFGWLEKATRTFGGLTKEIQIATSLAVSTDQDAPFEICPVFDDNNGNITFRLLAAPDQAYVINLTYQGAPNFLTSLYGAPLVLTSVAAASGNTTVYTGPALSSPQVNQYYQVSGFVAPSTANNGLYYATASGPTSITLQNPNGVAVTAAGTVAPATTWAPIPDKYNFLYERGMLAHLHGTYDAATYAMELELFFRQLVGCSEGLSDTAKAIFLLDRLAQLRTESYVKNATTATMKKAQ
jgi:hypothetical protein